VNGSRPPEQSGLGVPARALLVLAVAVLLGVALLAKLPSSRVGAKKIRADAGRATVLHPATTSTTLGTTTTTTTRPDRTTSTTGSTTTSAPATTSPSGTHAPGSVKVQVLNGSGGAKVAITNSNRLKARGYSTLAPANTALRTTTVVAVADGYLADGAAVAKALGLTAAAVQPAAAVAPSTNAAGANVVVILGRDTAGRP
jgi:hypothetical protein